MCFILCRYRKANGSQTFANFSPKIRAEVGDAGDGAVVIERNDAQQQTVEYVITISLSFSYDRSSLERQILGKWNEETFQDLTLIAIVNFLSLSGTLRTARAS